MRPGRFAETKLVSFFSGACLSSGIQPPTMHWHVPVAIQGNERHGRCRTSRDQRRPLQGSGEPKCYTFR